MNLEDVLLRDSRANQPAATDVAEGTLYYVTDEQITEQSRSGSWVDYSDSGGSGITQLTGDVTAGPGTGSQAATIANNAVTDGKLRDSGALSVIGRSANSSGDPADISAGTDHQVLRRSGTSLGFGALNLAQAAAVTGLLARANGGNGVDISSAALPLGSGQITFPSTQNPSADANTLDDYEEGTFNPTVTAAGGASGQTYSSQVGNYVKIGQFVCASFAVTLSAAGTLTGIVQVGGLPFTSLNLTGARWTCEIFWATLNTAVLNVQAALLENVVAANLNYLVTANISMTANTLAQADIANTSRFVGILCYRANA